MKIRTKLILRLLFISVLPLIVLVFLSYWNIYQTRFEGIAELENSIALQASLQTERWIYNTIRSLEMFIDPDIENFEMITEQQQREILARFLEVDKNIEEVALLDLDGNMRRRFVKGEGEAEPEKENFKDTKSFIWASQGEIFVSRVIFDDNKPLLGLVSPAKNLEGKIIAVLIARINLSSAQEKVLRGFQMGQTGYFYVVNQDGDLIAHSQRADLVGQNFKDNEGVRRALLEKALVLSAGEANRYEGISGEKVIGKSLYIPKLNWAVIVEWPEKEALEIVNATFFQTIIFSLIVLLAISLMASVFAGLVSNPIQKIREGAKIIGAGGFDHRIKIETKDELEELGNAFNEMTKGLKELSELKNEMVYIAAHELRSPVSIIRGYLSMLLESDLSRLTSEEKKFLERAFIASQRLNDLIDEILDVARTEGGRIEIKSSPQDLKEIVSSLVIDYKQKAKEKNLDLIYKAPDFLPNVLADQSKLKEIVSNLIDNAIKYTQKGSIIISHQIQDKFLITAVSDTGLGMTKEELSRLFGKFFRTETAREVGLKGTGLGLFITKQLVEKMGGKIWAESEIGKGTTFYFSLPLAKE